MNRHDRRIRGQRGPARPLMPAGDHPALPLKEAGVHRWVRSTAHYLTSQQAAAAAGGAHVNLEPDTLIRYGVGCIDCAGPYDQAKDLPCEVQP